MVSEWRKELQTFSEMKHPLYPWTEIPAVRGMSHFLLLGEIDGIGGGGRLRGGALFKLRNVLRRAVVVGFGKNRGSHRARVERHFLWRSPMARR